MKRSKCIAGLLGLSLMISSIGILPETAYAKESVIEQAAVTYVLDKGSKYVIDGASASDTACIGTLTLSGDAETDGVENGIEKINVNKGNLNISYQFDPNQLSTEDTEWHIVADKTNSINRQELSGDIKMGAVLVETSFDGEKWISSEEQLNYFSAEQTSPVYTTTNIQLLNGCYYRVTVAYLQERVSGSKKVLFVNTDEKETREIAEVYTFYAVDESAKSADNRTVQDEPRYTYDDMKLVVNAGKDTGYSKTDDIDGKDVHYGWSVGTFTINGYTDKKEQNGNIVYLKNVGDQVTLWFTLNQDIDALNGDSKLAINADTNGYDQEFQTQKTKMGRGTLIIRYTDSQNNTQEPVIYTDYLAACSTTSADTRVTLYEEGDYEVVLDYEIKKTPLKVGTVDVVPEITNYRIYFSFSVHNSNAMLFPFDIVTGSELIDQSITPNGFRIDLANSKDLNVKVARTNITTNDSGRHIEDVRADKAAKDGETYTAAGKYTLKVENTYTGEKVEKTIYVGTDPFLIAMANTGLPVDDLDKALSDGYTLADDGSLVASNDISAEVEEMVTTSTDAVVAQQQEELEELNVESTETAPPESTVEDTDEGTRESSALPIVLVIVLVIIVAAAVVVLKGRGGKGKAISANQPKRRPLPDRNKNVRNNEIIDVEALDISDEASEDTSDEDSWNDDAGNEEEDEFE